jgi:hypothetical protein
MGQMGDHHRGRDPGYHEPFLPDVLLSELEESRSGNRENLNSKTALAEFFIHRGEIFP